MEKWKRSICGYVHEGPMAEDFKCPICKQPAGKFVKIEEAAPAKNPYAGTKTEKNLWAEPGTFLCNGIFGGILVGAV